MASRRSNFITRVTQNPRQPYVFSLNMPDTNKLNIQAKNRVTKDTFYLDLSREAIRNLGFHQSVRGFYNRLRIAIEGQRPDELRAFFWFIGESTADRKQSPSPGDKMNLVLEESSQYDDEAVQWTVILPQLRIKDTQKLNEKLEDVVDEVDVRYQKMRQQLENVVNQVKQKFTNEREEREAMGEKLELLESAIRKLNGKVKELQGVIAEKEEKASVGIENTHEEISNVTSQLSERHESVQDRISALEQNLENFMTQTRKRFDDFRPKLLKLKSRKDFPSQQAYIDYMCQTLDTWDQDRFGPCLVRVVNDAGKAKAFVGLVGEPIKWNNTICKVRWFGLGQQQPESVRWNTLDIYLPLSAYYHPDVVGDQLADLRESSLRATSETTM